MSYSDRFYERLMAHEAPKPHRRKTRWPIRTTPPKCDTCRKQPPTCECKEQK